MKVPKVRFFSLKDFIVEAKIKNVKLVRVQDLARPRTVKIYDHSGKVFHQPFVEALIVVSALAEDGQLLVYEQFCGEDLDFPECRRKLAEKIEEPLKEVESKLKEEGFHIGRGVFCYEEGS